MKGSFTKVSKLSCALAVGATWGLYVLIAGWLSVTGMCAHMVNMMGDMYRGYTPGFMGGIVGGVWGFIDGFIAGGVFAFFYNLFISKRK